MKFFLRAEADNSWACEWRSGAEKRQYLYSLTPPQNLSAGYFPIHEDFFLFPDDFETVPDGVGGFKQQIMLGRANAEKTGRYYKDSADGEVVNASTILVDGRGKALHERAVGSNSDYIPYGGEKVDNRFCAYTLPSTRTDSLFGDRAEYRMSYIQIYFKTTVKVVKMKLYGVAPVATL